jgi:hypothetical protein
MRPCREMLMTFMRGWLKTIFSRRSVSDDNGCIFKIVELEYVQKGTKVREKKPRKIVSCFVCDQEGLPSIAEHISTLSGVPLSGHSSDFLYEGYDYLRGDGEGFRVIIVPARGIRNAPRKVRKPGWNYVSLSCAPDITLFDSFPKYDVLPASRR